MQKKRRLFNIRYIALSFAFLILGIAFFTNLTAGIAMSVVFLTVFGIIAVKKEEKLLAILFLIFFIGGGIYSFATRTVFETKEYPEDYGAIIGKISIASDRDYFGVIDGRIVIEDIIYNGEKIKGKATVKFENSDELEGIELKVGEKIGLEAKLTKIPLEISGIGSSSNYVDGIYSSVSVKRLAYVEEGEPDLRGKIILASTEFIMKNTTRDTGAFIIGMLFGDRSAMSSEMKAVSSRLGIAHLFAVSGLHVGMLTGSFIFILKRLKVSGKFRLLIIPFLIFYAYITGFTVSVVRAVIMSSVYLLSDALNRRYDMMTSFSIAGIVVLCIDPMYLFDLSFVLSFLAVFSLILLGKSLTKAMKILPKKFSSVLASTLSVNIGLMPVMLLFFGSVSILTLPMNLIAIPFISAYFPIFFLTFIIAGVFGFGGLLKVAAYPFTLLNELSLSVFRLDVPNISFDISYAFLIAYILLIALSSRYVFTSKVFKKAVALAFTVLVISSLLVPYVSHSLGNGEIVLCKSGFSSYSALIDNVDGKRVCVVSGDVDEFSVSKTVNMISKNGISKVDTIVVPTYKESEKVSILSLVNLTGAKEVIVLGDVFFSDLVKVSNGNENISVEYSGDVSIKNGEGIYVFVSPKNTFSKSGDYSLVVSMNKDYSLCGVSARYHLDFTQNSSSDDVTYFTYLIKNGKIINNKSKNRSIDSGITQIADCVLFNKAV